MKKTLSLLAALGIAVSAPALASPESAMSKTEMGTKETVAKAAGSSEDAMKAAETAKKMAKDAAKKSPAAGGHDKDKEKK